MNKYKYVCLMLQLDTTPLSKYYQNINGDDVIEWEGEPHATILYGIHEDQHPTKIKNIIMQEEEVEVTIEDISVFETPDADVLKFGLESKQLSEMNANLRLNLEYTNEHPDYNPHITIAYLKKGTGKYYVREFSEPHIKLVGTQFKLTLPPDKKEYFNNKYPIKTPPINENKDGKKKNEIKKVIYITDTEKSSKTREEFKKFLGNKMYTLDVKGLRLSNENKLIDKFGNNVTLNEKNKYKNDIIFIVRWDTLEYPTSMKCLKKLEREGYLFLNNQSVKDLVKDKYEAYKLLKDNDIPTPNTELITEEIYKNDKTLEGKIENVGGFPLILKPVDGSMGVAVHKVDDLGELKSKLQNYLYFDEDAKFVIQEIIESDGDYRVHVLRNTKGIDVLATMFRKRISKEDIRSNVSQGAIPSIVEKPDDKILNLAKDCCKVLNGNWLGVDVIGNKKDGYYVLEINDRAGLSGINSVLGRNMAEDVMKYFEENEGKPEDLTAGWVENVKIDGVEYPSKLDTGNGTPASTVHGKILKEDDKFIEWEDYKGTKHKSVVVSTITRERGNVYTEHKVIELPIFVGSRGIKDAKFIIDDRTSKSTPVLLNRFSLNRLSLIVDSNRKFILSPHINIKGWEQK